MHGSRTNPSSVDRWSDIDVKIVLQEGQEVDQNFIELLLKNIGTLIGKQTLIGEKEIVCRVVLQTHLTGDIEMIDFTLAKNLRGKRVIECKADLTDQEEQVFWFRLFLSAIKWMREDHLIGTHLLLDNLQILLEMEMRKRDERKQTNIHRFGDGENVKELLALAQLQWKKKSQIANYLCAIGEQYDRMMLERNATYEPKNDHLRAYLTNC